MLCFLVLFLTVSFPEDDPSTLIYQLWTKDRLRSVNCILHLQFALLQAQFKAVRYIYAKLILLIIFYDDLALNFPQSVSRTD